MLPTHQILEKFDLTRIKSTIQPISLQNLTKLEIFETLDSTNTYLLTQAKAGGASGWVCLAEQQTQGRGRQGRVWFSPYGANIYCSILWRFPAQSDLAGLSLAVAVMLKNVLKEYGVSRGIKLKWPNDVLFAGRKLAGILLESSGESVVIGIGINLQLPTDADKRWIGLLEVLDQPIRRNYLTSLLLSELLAQLPLYQQYGLAAFLSAWRQHDALLGQSITVHSTTHNIQGVAEGINTAGELLLRDVHGQLLSFRCGEVSVRLQE